MNDKKTSFLGDDLSEDQNQKSTALPLNSTQLKYTSQGMDSGFLEFMRLNPEQKTITPGDIIVSKINAIEPHRLGDLKTAVEKHDYKYFPFDDSLTGEIRGRVLLSLTEEDNEEKLLEELYELLPKVTSMNDFLILTSLIEVGRKRLPLHLYKFPNPLNGEENRSYCLDLLALKELVSVLKGEEVAPINLMAGFFASLIHLGKEVSRHFPPLMDLGGIVLTVKDNQLINIKVSLLHRAGTVGDDAKPTLSRYSPNLASWVMYSSLIMKFAFISRGDTPSKDFVNNTKILIQGAINKPTDDLYKDNTRYYVVVDGCVAGPSNFETYGYEKLPVNDTRIYAGEVFLFHKLNGKPRGTRIGFIPRDPNQVHPALRLGSFILGDTDMSYQSIPWNPKDYAENILNDYKAWWAEKVNQGNPEGDAYSPAMVMAYLNYLGDKPIDISKTPCVTLELLKPENKHLMEKVVHSVSGETDFTHYWWRNSSHWVHLQYSMDLAKQSRELFYDHITQLNRHWNFATYLEDGLGVEEAPQKTTVKTLCERFKEDKLAQNVKLYLSGLRSKKVG